MALNSIYTLRRYGTQEYFTGLYWAPWSAKGTPKTYARRGNAVGTLRSLVNKGSIVAGETELIEIALDVIGSEGALNVLNKVKTVLARVLEEDKTFKTKRRAKVTI